MPHFTAPDGAFLWYEEAGGGLPVLALSGLTRNGRDFDFVAPHLARTRLIRMDYRGRGRSDYTGAGSYTLPNEMADAIALLDHLGIDRAAILGTSRGGLIGMLMAAAHPARVLGVALNDVGPALETGGLAHIASYLGLDPPFASLDDAAAATDPAFPGVPFERRRAMLAHTNRETPEGLQILYDPELREATFGEAAQAAAAAADPDLLWNCYDAMAGLPVALIRGANSNLLSPETVEAMRARHPGLIVATVPDRGHTPYLDEPEALAALSQWLDQMQ